ncbi:MAG: hypothetical protein ACR2OU_21790 [Thermomicrobiales bacterium]
MNQSSVRLAVVRIVPVFLLMLTFMTPVIGSAQTVAPSSVEQAPNLPGVPKKIEVIAFGTLTLPAGDYRWQTTKLPAFANASSLVAVHRGFLIAVNNPVAILKADGTVQEVEKGSALPLAEGEQFAAVQVNGVPADMMIVEFPLVTDVDPKETPETVTVVPLKQGTYTFAVLAIPAYKPGDPTPGQILTKAAGPGIAVYPFAVGQAATPTSGANAGPFWLVAIFPAAETSTTGAFTLK